MTAMMVLMVTLIATLINIGLRHDFLLQWTKAYLIGWPVAAVTGYAIMPMARRFTRRRRERCSDVSMRAPCSVKNTMDEKNSSMAAGSPP